MGRASDYTAEQILQVRELYDRWEKVRVERIRLSKGLGLRSDQFSRIGRGIIGKRALRKARRG